MIPGTRKIAEADAATLLELKERTLAAVNPGLSRELIVLEAELKKVIVGLNVKYGLNIDDYYVTRHGTLYPRPHMLTETQKLNVLYEELIMDRIIKND